MLFHKRKQGSPTCSTCTMPVTRSGVKWNSPVRRVRGQALARTAQKQGQTLKYKIAHPRGRRDAVVLGLSDSSDHLGAQGRRFADADGSRPTAWHAFCPVSCDYRGKWLGMPTMATRPLEGHGLREAAPSHISPLRLDECPRGQKACQAIGRGLGRRPPRGTARANDRLSRVSLILYFKV